MRANETASNDGGSGGAPERQADSAPELARLRAVCRRQQATIAGLRLELSALRRENGRHPAAERPPGAGYVLPPVEVTLPADSRAPGAARIVLQHCLNGHVPPLVLQDAQLLVTEMVTNSCCHGELGPDDPIYVRVQVTGTVLRIEVENPGIAGVITWNAPDLRSGRGFGLGLVAGMSSRWGIRRDAATRVWADLACAPAPAAVSA